jgi:hypothetical protein
MATSGRSHWFRAGRLEQQVCSFFFHITGTYVSKFAGSKHWFPTPRPVKVMLPPVNFTAIAGKYNNNGYGSVELCLVSPKNPTASCSCQDLASNISTILPGVVNPKIPTFVAEWHSPWASHLSFMHFNGNTCNVSAFISYVSLTSLCIPLPH